MPDATAPATGQTESTAGGADVSASQAGTPSTSESPAQIPEPRQAQSEAGSEADAEWEEYQKSSTQESAATADTKDEKASDSTPKEDADAGPAALSDADKQAIRRHGMDPDEIQALRNLTPESRNRWIANLDKRAKFTDDLQRQLREIQGSPQSGTQEQQQINPPSDAGKTPAAAASAPELDAAWQAVHDGFDAYGFSEAIAPMRKALDLTLSQAQQSVQKATEPIRQLLETMLDRIGGDDKSAAFDALELPEGIDKNDPKVRQQLVDEADLLLHGSFDFNSFNYRHAIPRAAANLFHKQMAAAQAARKEQQRKQALRSSAEPATRSPTTSPRLDDEEFEDQALDAILHGDSRKLHALTA